MEIATTYRITETFNMNDFMMPTQSPESEDEQLNSGAQDANVLDPKKNEGVR